MTTAPVQLSPTPAGHAASPPRPMAGPAAMGGGSPTAVVPPAALPLTFFAAAGFGLVLVGLAVWFAADRLVVRPTHSGAVSAVHVAMLAFLSTAVLGALHQFTPVVSRRRLRSTTAGWVTLVGWFSTAWILPTGFAHGPEGLVTAGAVIGTTTVAIAVWNLSGPLASPDGGVPLWGLRFSVAYLAITVLFGAVYAFDRLLGWFPLLHHQVLAHAHLGLLGWLGLTYVAVAEKLWPMFLLAHRPHERYGKLAVGLLAAGAAILTPALLFGIEPIAWIGGLLAAAGLVSHMVSFASCVRHRRRKIELLHAYLFVSMGFLALAMLLAFWAAAGSISYATRANLVSAEVAALTAWLGLAIVGHSHKIVPFIGYSALRAQGITQAPGGGPLMFSHLWRVGPATAALVAGTGGFGAIVTGLLIDASVWVAAGGLALTACGLITAANLVLTPRQVTAHHRRTVESEEIPS